MLSPKQPLFVPQWTGYLLKYFVRIMSCRVVRKENGVVVFILIYRPQLDTTNEVPRGDSNTTKRGSEAAVGW
jgi:hypothetical protein